MLGQRVGFKPGSFRLVIPRLESKPLREVLSKGKSDSGYSVSLRH